MNNITLGQFIPGNSWIYKIDPRMKIILTFLLMTIVFMIPNVKLMIIGFILFILMFISTRISIIKLIKGLKPVVILMLFTFALQIIYNKEGNLLKTFNFEVSLYHIFILLGLSVFYIYTKKYVPIKMIYFITFLFAFFFIQYYFSFSKYNFFDYSFDIYTSGLEKGFFVFFRVILMIGLTSLLTFSTMNMDINNGLSSVLKPLKIIKFPVDTISMMLSLVLRFIPTLLDETNKIMRAQASRGVDFNEGRLKDKINQIISLLVPMFVISFKKADDLSNAMTTRGYVIDAPRTKLDEMKLRLSDYIYLIIAICILCFIIWSKYGV